MAKKKRKKPAPPSSPRPKLPDRRLLEQVVKQFTSGLPGAHAPDSPLEQAQAVMYEAFEQSSPARRVALAKKALTISPDCADAYVLLAEHATSRKEALAYYEQGVAAGLRALGPDYLQQHAGQFWGFLETRPYMRARFGLAHALWMEGRRDEAADHLQELLRLNPNDNQGARFSLAGWLLALERDDDLAKLLQQYPDDGSAAWAYTRALLHFRQHGDTPDARRLLKAAKKANRHVPAYLLGEKFPPPTGPDYYSPGDENEALQYIGTFLAPWKETPGAVAWLRHTLQSKTKKPALPAAKGPLGFIKKWLNANLPQEFDVWQAECRQLPRWLEEGGEKIQPWIIFVTSRSSELVLGVNLLVAEPPSAVRWDMLVQAMRQPSAGEPHRPSELQVRADPYWESLRPHLDEIGVELTVCAELDHLDELLRQMNEDLGDAKDRGLLDMPGVTPAQVGSYYEAAADFYQQAPWKKVGYESAIRIACAKYTGGPWYAVLMGQSGLSMGVALYENWKTLRKLMSGQGDDEANASESVGTSVIFSEAYEIPVRDLEAAKANHWKVARPDAYPLIFHKERGLAIRLPLAWELELMEACLRAIPDFVRRRKQDDPTPEEATVTVASGPIRLELAWMVES